MADTKLSHSFLRIGIVIKWHMNQNTGNAWPGVETIMRLARVSERTVNRAIKYFLKMGHMDVERRPGRVNHYFPQPELEAATTDKAMTGVTVTAMTGVSSSLPPGCEFSVANLEASRYWPRSAALHPC
jgi:Helix-turn-helix domain